MGVSQTHYVVIGVKFPFDAFDDSFQESVLSKLEDNGYKKAITKNEDELTCISDGMNGEYVIIGKVLAKALESDGLDLTEIPLSQDSYANLISFPRLAKDISKLVGKEITLPFIRAYAFTHFH